MAGATWNCCHLGALSVYTYSHATVYNVASFKAIHRVHVYLGVTCHLLFGQNDWDLLCATEVTQGWNRHWNKSQRRKLSLGNNIIPSLLRGLEPTTFPSWAWCSTTELPPLHGWIAALTDLSDGWLWTAALQANLSQGHHSLPQPLGQCPLQAAQHSQVVQNLFNDLTNVSGITWLHHLTELSAITSPLKDSGNVRQSNTWI